MAKHNNLNIPASIMISGVESDTYFDIVVRKCGIRFILMSYHYLQKKPKDFLRKRIEEFPDLKIFIDSGAHTFLTNMDEYMDKPLSYWEKYVTDYTDWVKENNEYIFGCANLDLEPILGNEKIDELNDEYFLPVEEVGVEVCYVWHTPRGEEGWEEYCKKHSYVGMSMQNDATATVQKLMRRLNVARKYNTRVHGMALTKTEILVRVPFFTADSSVDGDSSILVKDLKNDRTERLTIAELYNRNLESEFRTTEYETRVPYENYKVLTVDNDNKVIWGDLYGVVKHKVKKPTVKISVESGKNITCTTDHSIITMDKNGKLIETKADELKVGDYVLTPRQFDISNELVPFTNVLIDKPNTQTGEKEWQVVELSDKFLQFLGLWIGDGHFSGDTIGMSCYQDLECREVIDYVANIYNAKVSVDKNGIDSRISNVRLQRVMKALEFNGSSKTKRVPKFIYSLSKEQINQFLKGYFSADGTGYCECSTVSKELKEDLVKLLNMLGIDVSVSSRPSRPYEINNIKGMASNIWHLSIRNRRSKLIFKENIGFLQEYKNTKLNDIIIKTPSREPKNSGLPKSLAITDVIRTDAKHTTSVNKWKGDRISRKYEGVFHDKVSNSELVFLKIKSIEVVNDGTSEVEVYDLSVRDYERFFANGILVHNTTWLVGQQYGELNWFNGRKMQRLSKDQWRRQYKTQLLKEPFNADWDRLINGMGGQGDTYELLRLNVLAYILAEEHIRKRLHSKMYWMEEGVGVELVSLNSIVTPSKEWFDGECEDWKSYLEKLRLPTDNLEKDEAVNILSLFYIFVNDDYEELEEGYTEQELIDYAKLLGSESEDYQDSVEFMKEYFIDNATGKRNDFREVEMEEENSRAKERTSYIEDDVFDIIDLSEEQINNSLSLVAPKEMPEVDEYDEELRKNNIVPVRASDGKFLKGQKKVRRPKDIYSSKYPKLNCDTCYKSGDCPEYKAGFVCAFDKMFKRFDTRNSEDVVEAMSSMVNHNLERLQRAMLFETMDGGMATPEVTGLIDQNAKLLEKLQQLQQTRAQTVLQQRRTIMSDGTETIENSMSLNPQEGGILSKIFGTSSKSDDLDTEDARIKKKEEMEANIVEVEYV